MSGIRVDGKGIRVDVSVGELAANDERILIGKGFESSIIGLAGGI